MEKIIVDEYLNEFADAVKEDTFDFMEELRKL